jgi:predicted Zn-ribbon and HTH transcriptional regulator
MGAIAEMMLDGTLCQQCGQFIGRPCGYPVTCNDCRSEAAETPKRKSKQVTKRGGRRPKK